MTDMETRKHDLEQILQFMDELKAILTEAEEKIFAYLMVPVITEGKVMLHRDYSAKIVKNILRLLSEREDCEDYMCNVNFDEFYEKYLKNVENISSE